ncbi:MAG: hypothetical protein J5I98_08970, partial [Phaeodactylibacter sp.]|nr:hypothetical protein [Phaeodactylibacter sp.]
SQYGATALISDPSLNLFTATKNISEYFAVCSKLNIPLQKAYGFYKQVCQNTQILYPGHQSLSVLEQLLQKYQPTGNRVYDMEIVSVAIVHQIPETEFFPLIIRSLCGSVPSLPARPRLAAGRSAYSVSRKMSSSVLSPLCFPACPKGGPCPGLRRRRAG